MNAKKSSKTAEKLIVCWDNKPVGELYKTDPLSFHYYSNWILAGGQALSPLLPISTQTHQGLSVYAFFENLLPEADERKLLQMRFHVSSVFGMLKAVAGDTAGAITIFPEGEKFGDLKYQKLTWEDVRTLIGTNENDLAALDDNLVVVGKSRISISGAQTKLLLSIADDGAPLKPLGSSASTHILKPDIKRSDIRLFATAANEAVIMLSANLCGLNVAKTQYQSIVNACLVKRYDRIVNADKSITRLWQADFCQMLGVASSGKYEFDGGPSFADCFALVRKYSVAPAPDQKALLQWLFFNLFVGNDDSHAKNLSLVLTDKGYRLAPFYDLMSTRIYPGLSNTFAFKVGDTFKPGEIGFDQIEMLATDLDVSVKYVLNIAHELANKIDPALNQAIDELSPRFGPTQKALVSRLKHKVNNFTKKTLKRITAQDAAHIDIQQVSDKKNKRMS